MWERFFFSSHHGCWASLISSILFSFCHPVWLYRRFSCPFKYPMALLLFSRSSVRSFPFVDVLLMCLGVEACSMSSYSAILT